MAFCSAIFVAVKTKMADSRLNYTARNIIRDKSFVRYSKDKAVRSKYQQGLKHLLYGTHLLYNTITLVRREF
jgi:hypothetical protein